MTAFAHDVSANGLAFIAAFEGCVLHPYDDGGAPGEGNATIGIGHLLHLGPVTSADRKKWARFTRAQAITLLHTDAQHAVGAVRGIGVPLTQPQFDALTSFAFNCGGGALSAGITRDLHERQPALAMDVLCQYVHANGVVLQGLVRRRHAEAHLFLTGHYQ